MRYKHLWLAVALLMMSLLMAGCNNEYKAEVEQINSGIEALSTVKSGHITVTTNVYAENDAFDAYDSANVADYRYQIDIKTFNYVSETRDLATGQIIVEPYKVIDAEKFDLATGVQDTEYEGKIGDFPDLLPFYFASGLKNKFVGSIEVLTDENHPDWQGWRVYKSDNYIERTNKTRKKEEVDGTMLEHYVDYWLDADGVLVRMNYVSRDDMTYEGKQDTVHQSYLFEMLDYNNPEIFAAYAE